MACRSKLSAGYPCNSPHIGALNRRIAGDVFAISSSDSFLGKYAGVARFVSIGDIAFAGDQLALALDAATFATPGAGNGKTITDAASRLRGSV